MMVVFMVDDNGLEPLTLRTSSGGTLRIKD